MIDSNIIKDLIIGGVSAGCSKTLIAPIERVKLLLQLQDASKSIMSSKKYLGILDCFRRVHTEQGFLSFWRGNLSNVIRYFPAIGISFALKDHIRKQFPLKKDDSLSRRFKINLLAGGIASSLGIVLIYPLDVIRTRMATDIGKEAKQREFKGIFEVITKLFRADGLAGIYRGVVVSMVYAFVNRSIYFGLFDSAKDVLFEDPSQIGFWTMWMLAQGSAVIGGQVSYPFDTVRRRLMMQSGMKDVIYTGSWDCFLKIYRGEGVNGFFKGAASNVLRVTGLALALTFYNQLQLYFGLQSRFSE